MKKTLLASAVLLAFVSGANAASVEHIDADTSYKANAYSLTNPFLFENDTDSFIVKVTNNHGILGNKYASGLAIGQDGNLKGKIEIIGKQSALTLGQGNGVMNAGSIHLEGTNGYALDLYRHLELNANSVTIKSKGLSAVQFRNANSGLTVNAKTVNVSSDYVALNAAHKGEISITGDDVTIDAPMAIRVWGLNKPDGHLGSSLNVEAGTLNITGDIRADDSTTIKMEEGTIKSHIHGMNGADLDLGKGTWIVAEGNYNDGDNVLNSLTGNGTVDMSQVEDNIVVKGDMSGNATVKVDATKTNGLTVEGDSTAKLSVVTDQNADQVTKEQAAAMVTRMDGVEATASVDAGKVGGAIIVDEDGTAVQIANENTDALAGQVTLVPQMIGRIMMNDVRKRMGDLRAAEGTHGVWARYNGGQMEGRGMDADFNMIQVGIDTVPVADAPRFGVAFSYAQSEADDALGSADMDSFSLAFYGTKMYDNGLFVDVIGRMATTDTDLVSGSDKGSMDNVSLSLSGELGWRFDVTDRFFFEPSAELTYTYTNADTFTMTNGGKYELEDTDSLIGRAGFAAGFKCPANKGDVYVRAAVVHEFMGDSTMNSWIGDRMVTPVEIDGEDTYLEYAIGAQFNVNKNTYVYADIERTEGAAMDEDWRANVGVRYAF